MTEVSETAKDAPEGDDPAGPAGGGWRPGDREQVAVVSFSHTIQHSHVAMLGVVYPFALGDFHTSYAVLGVILGAVRVRAARSH